MNDFSDEKSELRRVYMGKQIYLSEKQSKRIEMLLIDLIERSDLPEEEEQDVRMVIEKLNK